jgi:toxin ParE1/3/4
MDFKVIWTPRSLETLSQAIDYIAERNPDAARRLGEAMLKKAGLLASFPRLGGVFTKLGREDIRDVSVPPYRIIYRIIDAERLVFILTVWHGARQEPEAKPRELE